MNTATKLGIGAALVGLTIWGYHQAKKAASNFAVKVTGYGIPKISHNNFTLPVKLQLTNPTMVPINFDRVDAEVYVLKSGTYVPVGFVSQAPVNVLPGKSEVVINPIVNLLSIVQGNVFAELNDLYKSGKLNLRTVITARYGSLTIKPSPFDNSIDIPHLQMQANA